MKTEEERRWVMPKYTDYSKPAYFYRLFHEGRPFLNALNDVAERFLQKRHWAGGMVSTGNVTVEIPAGTTKMSVGEKDGVPFLDFLTVSTFAGDPISPVDPLDGVW